MNRDKWKAASVVGMCVLFLASCALETALAFKRAGLIAKGGKKEDRKA